MTDSGVEAPISSWKKWLKEESDHQWLSLIIFTFAILIGAQMIVSASLTPGMTSTELNPEGSSIIEIEWNSDYSTALVLTNSHGERQIEVWGESDVISHPSFEGARTISSWEGGWLIGGDDGSLGRCLTTCASITPLDLNWTGGNIGQRIIGISSQDGDTGLLLVRDTDASVGIRFFNSTDVGPASEAIAEDSSLTAIQANGENTIAIGYGWFGKNPALSPANGIIVEIVGGDIENAPLIQLRHIGPSLYHTILVDSDSGSSVIVGNSDSMVYTAEGSFQKILDMEGANAAAIDGEGGIWLAGELSRGLIQYIEAGETAAEIIEVEDSDLDVSLMSFDGEVILFHGTDNSGAADIQFDPQDSKDSIAPSNFSRLLFIIFGTTLVVLKVWNIIALSKYKKSLASN